MLFDLMSILDCCFLEIDNREILSGNWYEDVVDLVNGIDLNKIGESIDLSIGLIFISYDRMSTRPK